VPLPEDDVERLMEATEAEIDLEAQVVRFDGREVRFDIDPDIKHRLLNGLDDIGITMQNLGAIERYEREREREGPVTTTL
jgi:3-isopropylmalate/(R)-2-methylmalate dehydratase small subunit